MNIYVWEGFDLDRTSLSGGTIAVLAESEQAARQLVTNRKKVYQDKADFYTAERKKLLPLNEMEHEIYPKGCNTWNEVCELEEFKRICTLMPKHDPIINLTIDNIEPVCYPGNVPAVVAVNDGGYE